MSEWQPIETCPKGWDDEFDLWATRRYTGCKWGRPTYSPLPKKIGSYCFVQMDASYDSNGPVDEEVRNPTHWMPIPSPPEKS